jgi:cytochrome c-type biogenesis protein CcmE
VPSGVEGLMRVKMTVAAIIVAGAAILFFLSGSGTSKEVFYVSPTEFKADPGLLKDRVRIKGKIQPGTVQASADKMDLQFAIEDGKESVKVHYRGAVPDAFQEGLEAVVDGRMGSQGVFECKELVVKCPSKYEAKPGAAPAAATANRPGATG